MRNLASLYASRLATPDQCLELLRSGDVITCASDCNEPASILSRLHTAAARLHGVVLRKGRCGRYPAVSAPDMDGHINTEAFFFGPDLAEGFLRGSTSFLPTDLPDFGPTANTLRPTTVYIASVTPMDGNGDFQVGLCLMYDKEALEACLAQPNGRIILEVNRQLKPVAGGLKINLRDVDCITEADRSLPQIPAAPADEAEQRIGAYVAELVHDGDCIQLGIGSLPDAVARSLMGHRDLGLHTEMFTSSMGEMIRRGVITGARKNFNPGLHLGTFAGGDQALYDTLSADSNCRMLPGSYVVDPMVIRQNDNMVSVNTLVEMDLTGQVCAESIGARQLSGSGGSFPFAYGAVHSKGGRSILAFASRSKKGHSKLSAMLTPGAAVTIPRNYVDYVVTEYGVAALRGRSVRQRTLALIGIAHPDCRAELTARAKELLYI